MSRYKITHKRNEGKFVTTFDNYTITYCNDVTNHDVSKKLKISIVLYDPFNDSILFLYSNDIRYISFAENTPPAADNIIKKHVMLNYYAYSSIPIIFNNITTVDKFKGGLAKYDNTNCNTSDNIIYKYAEYYIPVKILCRAHAVINDYNEYTYIAVAPQPIYKYNIKKCVLLRKNTIKRFNIENGIPVIIFPDSDEIFDHFKEKIKPRMKVVGANSFMLLVFLLFPDSGTIETHVDK